MITFVVIFIIILLVCFFFVVRRLIKLEKEQKRAITEIWNEKKERFALELKDLEKQKERLVDDYNKEKTRLNSEIEEKKNLNNLLLSIREEELDRLIEAKRVERETLLETQLKIEKDTKVALLNAEFEEFSSEQNKIKEEGLREIEKIKSELEDFRMMRESVNEAILREKEVQEKEAFYKIDISEADREDITILRSIAPQLKNKEALNKLIYEAFIRRPLIELIKRVTGGRSISGIYKITYIKTGESYIGRTTDIQTRWQNHIKTACGLEGAAHTTFHTRLEKDGIWNYTFEILEEAPKEKLNEREKFYIDLYGTDTQLNSKKGG